MIIQDLKNFKSTVSSLGTNIIRFPMGILRITRTRGWRPYFKNACDRIRRKRFWNVAYFKNYQQYLKIDINSVHAN